MNIFLTRFLRAIAVVASVAVFTGCNDAPGNGRGGAVPPTSEAVSIAAINAEAKGFATGALMSTRTVYVFFDSQCPHCAALWQSAKPLRSQAKFVWIPVGILNAASTAQGATLLAAGDPVALMDQHEASMQSNRGGITAASGIDAQKETVAKNTALLTRFGFSSIPTIVATHAQTGALVSREGSLPTAELASFLGLQVPAQ